MRLTFWQSLQRISVFTWSAILFSVLTLAALSFRVDANALQSFDEAWYADITRALVRSKNPLHLEFNQSRFTDHPPLGFVLMAVPTSILGSNELSTRLVSVVLSTATVALLILIGKELKASSVGFGAALILLSCLWYVLRARSGNLDAPFVFWETLCVFLALRVKKSPRAWYGLALSFSALFLTKTLIGVAILPTVLLCVWPARRTLTKSRVWWVLLLVFIPILPWYVAQTLTDPNFLLHHFVEIGARGDKNSLDLTALLKNLMYIRSGIGKWFYVFWLSLAASLLGLVLFPKKRRKLLILLLWTASYGLPFFLSSQSEIWHFIPVYPAAALLISYTMALFCAWATDRFVPQFPALRQSWLLVVLAIAGWQFHQMRSLIYPPPNPPSTERDIAYRAQPYSRLVLMETFYPALVYYSDTKVEFLHIEQNSVEKMLTRLRARQGDVFVVSQERAREIADQNVPFVILDQNSAYAIIQAPQEGR